jgi:hypothetical protein
MMLVIKIATRNGDAKPNPTLDMCFLIIWVYMTKTEIARFECVNNDKPFSQQADFVKPLYLPTF